MKITKLQKGVTRDQELVAAAWCCCCCFFVDCSGRDKDDAPQEAAY